MEYRVAFPLFPCGFILGSADVIEQCSHSVGHSHILTDIIMCLELSCLLYEQSFVAHISLHNAIHIVNVY